LDEPIKTEKETEMEPEINVRPKQATESKGNERVETFARVCASCEKLFKQKNEQYDDTIAATGVLGASVELIGTVARLRKMVLQSSDGGKSQMSELADIYKDIHNYSNIALMMMNEDNWRGK
jgi:hypothetical protein